MWRIFSDCSLFLSSARTMYFQVIFRCVFNYKRGPQGEGISATLSQRKELLTKHCAISYHRRRFDFEPEAAVV